ncbi:MAG: hypothetical protein WAM62_13300 [Pseudolabrys sp.]
MKKAGGTKAARSTVGVSADIFKQVYDSPQALPGKHRWVTSAADVRAIEKLLGIGTGTIGAPLWVSGDTKNCKKCGRETNWFDIVSSAVTKVHGKDLLVKVILGDKKFVNVEAPKAIADLSCAKCKSAISDLRSFKCHNWAYAFGDIAKVLENAGLTRT